MMTTVVNAALLDIVRFMTEKGEDEERIRMVESSLDTMRQFAVMSFGDKPAPERAPSQEEAQELLKAIDKQLELHPWARTPMSGFKSWRDAIDRAANDFMEGLGVSVRTGQSKPERFHQAEATGPTGQHGQQAKLRRDKDSRNVIFYNDKGDTAYCKGKAITKDTIMWVAKGQAIEDLIAAGEYGILISSEKDQERVASKLEAMFPGRTIIPSKLK